MEKKLSLFLGTISCALLVLCSATQFEEYVALEKAVNSLSNIIGTYNTEFDRKVKFNVLQDAIDLVNVATFTYYGEAKKNLDEVSQLGIAAGRTYHECVRSVFEWCYAMNNTLGMFTPYITDTNMTLEDRNVLWNMTLAALASGLNQTSTSLDLLDALQSKLEPGSKLVVGSIGAAFNMLPIFVNEGLADVMDPRTSVPIEQQMRTIQVFFQTLGQKFNFAKKIAMEVNAALKEDHQNLNSLASLIDAANRKEYLLLTDPNLRAQIMPKLIYMGQKCHEYVIWHAYGSKAYLPNQVRPKRQATESYEIGKYRHLVFGATKI